MPDLRDQNGPAVRERGTSPHGSARSAARGQARGVMGQGGPVLHKPSVG